MSKLSRALAFAALPVVFLAASAFAQDDKKKETGKPRLPNNWKALELTDQQKEQYYRMAGARDKQMDALKADVADLQKKLTTMRTQYKELDDGDVYLSILTPDQRDKLGKIKAESAKKSAEKAAAKAKEMEKKTTKTPKTTGKKEEKKMETKPKTP